MQQIGPYRIQGEVARGGSGVVYRGQGPDGRAVALKLLLGQQASHARQRLQGEVRALSRLRHPNVVSLLSAGEHQGTPWLALDYVEGSSLGERLRREGRLPIEDAIGITQQVAQALAYVHTCGVLHRDLKPDNVLLRGNQALLTDFGLVQDADASVSRLTGTGVFLGTPGYWAPEQASGNKQAFGPHTDLYGLGATLYASLTGRAPIEASSLQGYLEPKRFRQVPPPHVLRSEVPRWLSDLCMHCLEVQPDARPVSADHVARALSQRSETRATLSPSRTGNRVALIAAFALVVALTVPVVWLCGSLLMADADSPAEPQPSSAAAEPPPEPSPPPDAQPPEPHSPQPSAPQWTDPKQANAYLQQGVSKGQRGNFAGAIEDLTHAIRLDPNLALAYLKRSIFASELAVRTEAYAETKRLNLAAIDDLHAVLRLEPNTLAAYANLGAIHTRLKDFDAALEALDQALEIDPDVHEALVSRGTVKSNLGDFAGALEDLNRALQLAPTNSHAYTARGSVWYQSRKFSKAVVDLDRALQLNSNDVDAYYYRGLCRNELMQLPQAIGDFDQAVRRNPGHVAAINDRGSARLALRDFAGALADFDHALRLNPGNTSSVVNRGLTLSAMGKHAEAIQAFDRGIELDPNLGVAYYMRGASRADLDQHDKALADFDKAAQLGVPASVRERLTQARARAAAAVGGH